MKRPRSARPGREYRAEAEITYTGETLPDDARESFTSALMRAMGREARDLSWSVSSDPYSRLSVSVVLVAERPLAAITRLDMAVDDALTATGLGEEFDVTGRVLHVAPVERVWLGRPSSGVPSEPVRQRCCSHCCSAPSGRRRALLVVFKSVRGLSRSSPEYP